jgi:hypothetical protein
LGGIRGTSLFPHSIRSTPGKGQPARVSDPGYSVSNGGRYYTDNGSSNGHFSGDSSGALSHHGRSSISSPDRESVGADKEVLSELDIYSIYYFFIKKAEPFFSMERLSTSLKNDGRRIGDRRIQLHEDWVALEPSVVGLLRSLPSWAISLAFLWFSYLIRQTSLACLAHSPPPTCASPSARSAHPLGRRERVTDLLP